MDPVPGVRPSVLSLTSRGQGDEKRVARRVFRTYPGLARADTPDLDQFDLFGSPAISTFSRADELYSLHAGARAGC